MILFDDYESEYSELLEKSESITMLPSELNCIILEVFNQYIMEAFVYTRYVIPCEIHLNLSNRNDTNNFGLTSFTYLGNKLRNELPNDFKHAYLALFRDRLRH